MMPGSSQNRISLKHRTEMTNEPTPARFSEKSLQFLKSAGNQDDAGWLEENDADFIDRFFNPANSFRREMVAIRLDRQRIF